MFFDLEGLGRVGQHALGGWDPGRGWRLGVNHNLQLFSSVETAAPEACCSVAIDCENAARRAARYAASNSGCFLPLSVDTSAMVQETPEGNLHDAIERAAPQIAATDGITEVLLRNVGHVGELRLLELQVLDGGAKGDAVAEYVKTINDMQTTNQEFARRSRASFRGRYGALKQSPSGG
jgi:hypothetical protein